MSRVAISIGDPNGVGLEIALKAHVTIRQWCDPVYCADRHVVASAAALLDREIPKDFHTEGPGETVTIRPGIVSADAGHYSYRSFQEAIALAESGAAEAIVTLPIHKEAWMQAGVTYKGHTDMLRHHFDRPAIMMLGCEQLYVALYTEHIPLRAVAVQITEPRLSAFLLSLHRELQVKRIAVLGLNPHAGDNGVLGDEEREITAAIRSANAQIGTPVFIGPIVPDIAFTPTFRANHRHIVAMYHDQGLAPLKALYFDESINVSLNLPIIRTSVDHGTAFDIAYQGKAHIRSYENAVKTAVRLKR